ncbi:MAG TPA: T9SS type A sorting domain-containing protein [Flavobacterium sp.]|nr:T9SS type A sorting domain-containing protein [Flavobacterium sp.]
MKRKLLFLSVFISASAIGQNSIANAEIQAKQLAAQTAVVASVAKSGPAIIPCVVNAPYFENFESVTLPALPECTVIENAGTGNNFETAATAYGFNSKTLRYPWNTASAANAWFFTPGINMVAGQSYQISYKYGSAGSALYTEKLKVHVGSDATVASMSAVPLIDHPLVNNNVTPLVDTLIFTPETTGAYYFGFNCYSLIDQFYLFVDDISVDVVLATDGFDAAHFSYFPNPVKDVLNIAYDKNIDAVKIYNLTGQTVINRNINSDKAQIEMQSLPKGAYFAEIVSGTSMKTIKVIKE